jgi:regulatory protein
VKTKQNEALKYALRLIAKRDTTESEMRDRLQKKGFSEKDINETIQYLKQKGFIDDSKFIKSAEKIAEDKFLGEMGLRNYLSRKGIDRELLINLPQLDEFSIAKRLLERKKHFLKDSAPDKKKAKIAGFLLRRGFSWDTVNKCLKEVLK